MPVKFAGLGVNQTKVVAGSAYVGSYALTRDLVAALLGHSSYEPTGVTDLLSVHEALTGASHDFESLSTTPSVQQLLSSERYSAMSTQLRAKVSVRSQNLMLACAMPHASDWLLAPPIPGLGLALGSDCFRTMDLRCCFVTTASATFLATRHEVLVSAPL